jgi:hypothetical protein
MGYDSSPTWPGDLSHGRNSRATEPRKSATKAGPRAEREPAGRARRKLWGGADRTLWGRADRAISLGLQLATFALVLIALVLIAESL